MGGREEATKAIVTSEFRMGNSCVSHVGHVYDVIVHDKQSHSISITLLYTLIKLSIYTVLGRIKHETKVQLTRNKAE